MNTSQSKRSTRIKDLKNLLEINQSLVTKLTELIEQLKKHIRDCLIAKTTGVSVAAVGTSMVVGGWIAGLILAVPTFGLSLTVPAVMTVAGTATAIAGGLTTAGTEIANGIISRQFLDELANLQKSQAMAAKEPEETLRTIKHVINIIEKDKNEDETLLIALAFQGIKSEEIDLDNFDEMCIQQLRLKLRACNPDEINEYSTNNIARGGIKVAGAALTSTALGVSGLIDDMSIAAMRSLGIGTSSAVLQSALRSVAASVGVIFTVFDIVRLVGDYKDPNPLMKELERVKGLYLNDIDLFETMGPWSDESITFIDKVGSKLYEQCGDKRSKFYLIQKISLAIHRGNVASIMGTIPPSRPLNEIFYL